MTAKGESGMDTIAGPTPRPWKWDGDDLWHIGLGYEGHNDCGDPHRYVGINIDKRLRDSPILQANKDLVLHAVNCHDDLVAACAAIADIDDWTTHAQLDRVTELARAALSKARQP